MYAPKIIIVATNSNIYVLYTAGEITAAATGVALVIMELLIIMVFLLIIITLKLKNDGHRRVIQSLKSEIR